MIAQDIVLKGDEVFFGGEGKGNRSDLRAAGLYVRDTRHLAQFRVTLAGEPAQVLSVRVHNATMATIVTANAPVTLADGTVLLPNALSLEHRLSLDVALHLVSVVQNFSGRRVSLTLAMEFAADFEDLFHIRGFVRSDRGRLLRPKIEGQEVRLAYREMGGLEAATVLSFNRETSIKLLSAASLAGGELVSILPGTRKRTGNRQLVIYQGCWWSFPSRSKRATAGSCGQR